MSTAAQIAANQANALDEPAPFSEAKTQKMTTTGPKTENGKSKSTLTTVKTGLTGRTVLLPTDDAALYESHVAQFMELHKPNTDEERNLVQSLAATEWRLLRIPALEAGIYAVGRLEFAELFPNEDEAVRKRLMEAKVFLAYQRQLNNLSIQESRLRRQREKDSAKLHEIQEDRKRKEKAHLDKAANLYIQAVDEGWSKEFDPADFGFDFSIGRIEVRAMQIKPDLFAEWEREQDEAERQAA